MPTNNSTPTRAFGGKVSNFDNKAEEIVERKHLKAYLKGKKFFKHEGVQYAVKVAFIK